MKTKNITVRSFSNNKPLVNRKRLHIIQCSAKVFSHNGYARTNMRQIIKACGTSAGALYHYFGSKEEILYSIINNATSNQADYIEDLVKDIEAVAPTKAITELIKKHFQWHNENQDITLFSYQETKNLTANARESIFNSESRIVAAFEKILQRGIDSGDFSIIDPKMLAHNIVIIGHAWAFRRWYLRKHWTFQTYLRKQINYIMKTIKCEKE